MHSQLENKIQMKDVYRYKGRITGPLLFFTLFYIQIFPSREFFPEHGSSVFFLEWITLTARTFQLCRTIDSLGGIVLALDDFESCSSIPVALEFIDSIKWRMRVHDFEQRGKVEDGGVKDGECKGTKCLARPMLANSDL